MRNGKDNNSCLFGEQLVSYIYNELPVLGREAFEEHLLNCSGCTDEFAAVSMSRLGVYEWHRDDFLPLETPVFSIPYATPTVQAEPQMSWLDALRGLFSPARAFAFGGGLAALAIVLGAVYVATFNDNTNIAEADTTPKVVQPVEVPNVARGSEKEVTPKALDDENQVVADYKPSVKPTRTIQAKAVKRETSRSPVQQAKVQVNAPRLGTYDESEDTSLRLADLVADIDTIDF